MYVITVITYTMPKFPFHSITMYQKNFVCIHGFIIIFIIIVCVENLKSLKESSCAHLHEKKHLVHTILSTQKGECPLLLWSVYMKRNKTTACTLWVCEFEKENVNICGRKNVFCKHMLNNLTNESILKWNIVHKYSVLWMTVPR